MNSLTNLNIRIDKNLKEQSELVFESLGLNMSTAINIFLRQVVRVNGLPFEVKGITPTEEALKAMNDSIKMSNKQSKECNDMDDLE